MFIMEPKKVPYSLMVEQHLKRLRAVRKALITKGKSTDNVDIDIALNILAFIEINIQEIEALEEKSVKTK